MRERLWIPLVKFEIFAKFVLKVIYWLMKLGNTIWNFLSSCFLVLLCTLLFLFSSVCIYSCLLFSWCLDELFSSCFLVIVCTLVFLCLSVFHVLLCTCLFVFCFLHCKLWFEFFCLLAVSFSWSLLVLSYSTLYLLFWTRALVEYLLVLCLCICL